MRKDKIANISKNLLFYFYFESIVGSGVGSESVCWTGECCPELAILTARMTLLFGLGIRDRFPECLLVSSANLFSYHLSSINAIFFEVKASASALLALLTSNCNFRISDIKAAFVLKRDDSPVFSKSSFSFWRLWSRNVFHFWLNHRLLLHKILGHDNIMMHLSSVFTQCNIWIIF